MERLTASPLLHIAALIVCFNALLGVGAELACEAGELILTLFFELPWMGQAFEVTSWYVLLTVLLWAVVSMTLSPVEEDDESSACLVIIDIEFGPVD